MWADLAVEDCGSSACGCRLAVWSWTVHERWFSGAEVKLIFVNRFFHPDHSATAQLLTSLAFALVERGWDVHVVSSRQRYDAAGARLPARELVRGIHVHRVWTSDFGRARLPGRMTDYLTFYSSAAWRLWRLARRDDIILAKTDPPMLSVVGACVASARKARLVNWLQDLFPEVAQVLKVRGVNGVIARVLRNLRDRSLGVARTNIVLGERMRERVKSAGVAPPRVCIIPNWECGQAIKPVANGDNRLRREWRLEDKFVVGYSGNMGRAHEFETILQAAKLLKEQDSISFVWIGDGAQRPWLEQEALRWGLTSFVFKPYQARDRLFESLSLPDVHLISLRPALEGLIVPSKFYGVAAAGRPTLFIGDVDGEIAVLLRQHQCGYSVAPGDSEALARYIFRLSANIDECRLMGARARRVFDANYEKQIALHRWETVLQQIARVKERSYRGESDGDYVGARINTRSRVRVLTPAPLSIQSGTAREARGG